MNASDTNRSASVTDQVTLPAGWREIPLNELDLNPFRLIGQDWVLLTAGNESRGFNTMTASWGHLGSIWGRPGRTAHSGLPTAVVWIRPQRYTKEFFNREEYFTLTGFGSEQRKALGYLGAVSGRDEDKIAKTGLTPLFLEGTTAFAEAELILVCRKVYQAPLLEKGFVDRSLIETNYPTGDFHEMYVGEILKVLVRS